MPVLVVGSIALDTIHTPDKKDYVKVPGGSCTYFSYCASFLTSVRLVGVVGDDFPKRYIDLLRKRKINLDGLEIIKGSKTFEWHGTYEANMSDRTTDYLSFGVLENFNPTISKKYSSTPYLFLACSQPEVQSNILDQMSPDTFTVCDTIEIYIKEHRSSLDKLIKRCQGFIINDDEARMMFNKSNLVQCAHDLLKMGLQFAIIKKGENGSLLATKEGIFPFPAYPLGKVYDTTGAGDCFAGGVMGYLSKMKRHDTNTLRKAILYGTTLASFACEGISLNRLSKLSPSEVKKRVLELTKMVDISHL